MVAVSPVCRHGTLFNPAREARVSRSALIDIGTAVFPRAAYKFYLDASAEERIRRRHRETDGSAGVEAVGESLQRRDVIDSSRESDPLRVADDAVVIDSTDMTVEDVVHHILGKIHGP